MESRKSKNGCRRKTSCRVWISITWLELFC